MVGEWLPRPRGPLPCPGLQHPEPLPLRESTADPGLLRRRAHTALAQPVWGPWVLVPLFECSERLWQEWGLILNANPPLLPSCWGFSFALGHGVSHSRSSACRLTGVSLTLGMGYLMAAPGCAATIRCSSAMQASLSITNSWSLLKLMSIESAMPSNHLILSCPLFLLPSIFSGIRIFSNEAVLRIRLPKYWSFSFSISPSNEYSG